MKRTILFFLVAFSLFSATPSVSYGASDFLRQKAQETRESGYPQREVDPYTGAYLTSSSSEEVYGPEWIDPSLQKPSEPEPFVLYPEVIILNLALTIILYLGIPILIRKFSKSIWTKRKRRIIIFCNASVVYLLLSLCYFIIGVPVSPNLTAAVIWSWIALFILKRWNPVSK